MSEAVADPGSFRDPSGRIYQVGGQVFRTITDYAAKDYEFVRDTGVLERLCDDGKVIASKSVSRDVLGFEGRSARYVVEHPRLPFISYPYEWSFPALKAAALLHLDVHIAALDAGVTLSDATAYNVQFLGANPVFIDLLSFRQYREGEIWTGHRQFCEQFVNPLLLRAKLGVTHNAWYRGTQEGISARDLHQVLPWTKKLSRNVLIHVVAQSALQKSATASGARNAIGNASLPLSALQKMLSGLRQWIETLEPADTGKTVWQNYAGSHSYTDDEVEGKKKFIAEFAAETKPSVIWDLGCNSGDYSKVALENGAEYAVGFDFDHGALERAFARARAEDLKFQATFFDGANPSPNQGWSENERQGLAARANADVLVALALIHHFAIGKNLPLRGVVNWLVGLAPEGVIEFVPKGDPMVNELLALREDIFPNYTEKGFVQYLTDCAEIVTTSVPTKSGRKMFRYKRKQ